jgi:hypothetical protein
MSTGLIVAASLAGACGGGSEAATGTTGSATSATGATGSAASTTAASGGTGGAVGTGGVGGAGGTVGTGGTGGSAPAMCGTQAEIAQRWAAMDTEPIGLLGRAGGLNLLPDLTLAQAELINCKGTNIGDVWGDGSNTVVWGDSSEVTFRFRPDTGIGDLIQVWPLVTGMGPPKVYSGALTFKSPGGTDTYVMKVHGHIEKNGAPLLLGVGAQASEAALDELSRALTATFTQDAPDPPGTTCLQSGKCAFAYFSSVGTVTFFPVALLLWIDLPADDVGNALVQHFDLFKSPAAVGSPH